MYRLITRVAMIHIVPSTRPMAESQLLWEDLMGFITPAKRARSPFGATLTWQYWFSVRIFNPLYNWGCAKIIFTYGICKSFTSIVFVLHQLREVLFKPCLKPVTEGKRRLITMWYSFTFGLYITPEWFIYKSILFLTKYFGNLITWIITYIHHQQMIFHGVVNMLTMLFSEILKHSVFCKKIHFWEM